MTALIIGFLTIVMVLNCAFLILLVLIQLPKKESGLGMAFGGATAEAIFGAGSGNVLTKVTKYSAATFMGLSLLLSVINAHRAKDSGAEFEAELEKRAMTEAAQPVAPAGDDGAAGTSGLLLNPTNVSSGDAVTNLMSVPAPDEEESVPVEPQETPEANAQPVPGGE